MGFHEFDYGFIVAAVLVLASLYLFTWTPQGKAHYEGEEGSGHDEDPARDARSSPATP